jgi:hypothetical protein
MITMIYPRSRISSSGYCDMCRGTKGYFENRGIVKLQTIDGEEVKLLRLTCDYCGYTMLFDPSVPKKSPYRGEGNEEIPNFE